jgi:uncharacterized repeat protein (TIGR01451 family)
MLRNSERAIARYQWCLSFGLACEGPGHAAGMGSMQRAKRAVWLVAMLLGIAFHSPAAMASLTFYTDKPTFQAANPGLTTEHFESTGNFDPSTHYIQCSDPYDYHTSDSCWKPGDIVPGLTIGSSSGGGTVVVGPAYYGTPSIVTGANNYADATEVGFTAGTLAAGMDLVAAVQEDFTISIYGENDVLLGSTTAPGSPSGLFFGVQSTQAIKRIELTSVDDTLVDNVSFQAPPAGSLADMAISMTGAESPPGTFTYTVTVTNLGPNAAAGIATSVTIPSGLAYVSNDCGAAAATSPWTWNVASLANGNSAVCHIVTTVADPHGVVVNASVATSGTVDLYSQNNTAKAYGPTSDVGIAITGVESPPGTMIYTVTVSNSGPHTALDTVARFYVQSLSALTYVSDDCGGSNSLLPWIWNIPSLMSGNNVVCHVYATIGQPQGVIVYARIQSTGLIDLNNANDNTYADNSPTGPGPETPAEGIALFRSFYNLPYKDQTGAAFSLRANADKVMLLQICAVWCPACANWTQLSSQLEQAVDQQIGAGNFLDVDVLVQNNTYGPSTQADALSWKTSHAFPGSVLHSEGSYFSPVWELDVDRSAQYAAIPGGYSFYPEFFILAPAATTRSPFVCGKVLLLRCSANPPQSTRRQLTRWRT